MKRGEIWWVRFPPPVGSRPAVLVSRNEGYRLRSAVTVVPLTRTARGIRVEVPLGPADGIKRSSVANADDITTVPKTWLQRYMTVLSPEKEVALDQAITFALDLRS